MSNVLKQDRLARERGQTATVTLSRREITLIRVALMDRMKSLATKPGMAESYTESRNVCAKLWDTYKEAK